MGGGGSTNKKLEEDSSSLAIKNWLGNAKSEFEGRWKNSTSTTACKLSDFDIQKTLGSGSFGRVMAVQHKPTKQFYAMKILDKTKIVHLNHGICQWWGDVHVSS
ncbi:unnamed protein product [Allacma fusca]|uniref:Protein kinase domain-containing protein n=1 Tax=Allacma fusca TaxID=39272 RepID=A0A8J2LKI9_9HEXA|nr:unnamed protein product [Allacma fusca]